MSNKKYFDMGSKASEDKIKFVKDLIDKGMEAHDKLWSDEALLKQLEFKGKPLFPSPEYIVNHHDKAIEDAIFGGAEGLDMAPPEDGVAENAYWKSSTKGGTYEGIVPSTEIFWSNQKPTSQKPKVGFDPAGQGANPYYTTKMQYIPSDELKKAAAEKQPMWVKKKAFALISSIQAWAKDYNYHICLGGGVLNNGKSNKDLDIYFLPLNNDGSSRPFNLIHDLQLRLQAPATQLGHDYPEKSAPYIFKGKLMYQGIKRIDFFVMGTAEEGLTLSKDMTFLIDASELEKQSIEIEPANIIHFKKIPK